MTVTMIEDASFKVAAGTTTKTRVLDFYACCFGNLDKNGDVIDPHALDAWLKSFYALGKPLPISFAHGAVINSADPFAIIGSAPADPEHVWLDDYGLRVKANLDVAANDTAKQVASLIDQGVITGASIAFTVTKEEADKSGAQRIMEMQVKEAGPCLSPANESAVVLALKQVRDELLDGVDRSEWVVTKVVDSSAWDGNKAMGMCDSAAMYESICAAVHTTGEAGQRQHYALPHHYPSKGPNEAGVKAALSRVSQTQNITDAERASAQRHLEAHMKEINPDSQATEQVDLAIKHAQSPAHLQAAHDALVRAGAKCANTGSVEKTVEQGERDVQDRLRNLRWMEKGLL